MLVKTFGRRQWKKASGYHRQGRVENTFFRYKSIIGDGLRARGPAGQESEVVLGCEIINRMTTLGPTSVVSHRQVRILSGGIVRASDDSCNNAGTFHPCRKETSGPLCRRVLPSGTLYKASDVARAVAPQARLGTTRRELVTRCYFLSPRTIVSGCS